MKPFALTLLLMHSYYRISFNLDDHLAIIHHKSGVYIDNNNQAGDQESSNMQSGNVLLTNKTLNALQF